ncbi:TD and POZ domain-containing protein 4-like [Uloborus diversus]|uniref:TD and POZ domain-containing protein 4-like n=1 Tax=Uloborus diversus TaxID=327109 RepID=UPI00240A4195|nr:TD and POZ domain-containing protein 4-like [Uloborus diversus]
MNSVKAEKIEEEEVQFLEVEDKKIKTEKIEEEEVQFLKVEDKLEARKALAEKIEAEKALVKEIEARKALSKQLRTIRRRQKKAKAEKLKRDSSYDSLHVKHSTKFVGGGTVECATVTWKIANYRRRAQKANDEIKSREFYFSDSTWQLRLHPNGSRLHNNVGYIGIYLEKTNSTVQNHLDSMKFGVSIRRKEGKLKCFARRRRFKIDNDDNLCWGYRNVLSRDEVLRSTSEPQNINTDSNALYTVASALLSNDLSPMKESISTALANDFETLYNHPNFADVTLQVGDHKFLAHKLVLSSRSEVFAAMLQHDMQENRQDIVYLAPMEVDTAKDMLRYIYCGKVRWLDPKDALSLYVAAHRYNLQELVLHCRSIMLNGLSIDNICILSSVADMYHDQTLIDAVKVFLSENTKEVLKTDEWKQFASENPSLVLNLIQSAILNT